MSTTLDRTTLYYRAGSSDKVYVVELQETPGGYLVAFQNGRRGGTLRSGLKTKTPVSEPQARKIYDALVASKRAGGYEPGEEVGAYVPPVAEAGEGSVQLLNAIEETEVERYITDPNYLAQQKHDGERFQLGRKDGQVFALNRKGAPRSMPESVAAQGARVPGDDFVIDGEIVGDRLFAFDLLTFDGTRLGEKGYGERWLTLLGVLTTASETLTAVETAFTEDEKRALFARLRDDGQEGVVFKHKDAPHTPGRPPSGGDWLKFKFYETATARVQARNGTKRSVALEMLDEYGAWVGVGNVTVPANQAVPAPGDLVSVRYLYAYRGGSLFQPVLLGHRTDQDEADCSMSQLKYKPEGDATA